MGGWGRVEQEVDLEVKELEGGVGDVKWKVLYSVFRGQHVGEVCRTWL